MSDEQVFAMYFSGIAAFQYHPANPVDSRMDLNSCAAVACEMLRIHRILFPKE